MLDCLLLIDHWEENIHASVPAIYGSLDRFFKRHFPDDPAWNEEYNPPTGYMIKGRSDTAGIGSNPDYSLTAILLATVLRKRNLSVKIEEGTGLTRYAEKPLSELLQTQQILTVGLSSTFLLGPEPLNGLIEFIRQHNSTAKIIIGGQGILDMRVDGDITQMVPGADVFILGDAEEAFPEVVQRIKQGRSLANMPGVISKTLAGFVGGTEATSLDVNLADFPDFRLQRFNGRFTDFASLEEGRGCVFRCAFCSFHQNNTWRKKSVDRLVAEVKNAVANGYTRITFTGAEFITPKDQTAEFCRRIIAEGIKVDFASYARLDILFKNRWLADLMREAGWKSLFFGVESGDQGILKIMNKNYDITKVPDTVHYLQDTLGIKVNGSFVIGYPGETEKTIESSKQVIEAANFAYLFFDGFYMLKNTPVYRDKEKLGLRFIDKSGAWVHPTMNSYEIPELMHDLIAWVYSRTTSEYAVDVPIESFLPVEGHEAETKALVKQIIYNELQIRKDNQPHILEQQSDRAEQLKRVARSIPVAATHRQIEDWHKKASPWIKPKESAAEESVSLDSLAHRQLPVVTLERTIS
jgi:radical SAM superfamily enzyme YgiQ (UPF0313 family)